MDRTASDAFQEEAWSNNWARRSKDSVKGAGEEVLGLFSLSELVARLFLVELAATGLEVCR